MHHTVSHGSPDLKRNQSVVPLPTRSWVRHLCLGTPDDNEHYDLNVSGVILNCVDKNTGELITDLHYLLHWISLSRLREISCMAVEQMRHIHNHGPSETDNSLTKA